MNKKAVIGIVSALVVAIAAAVCVFFVLGGKKEPPKPAPKKEVVEPEPITNPLTGSEDFDENALKRRVAAFVIENHPDARPQIGMDDKKYSPDIILEGEVEGGISRMLWFFADYKKLPKTLGPTRSARPPYIRFSKAWDAIFMHWGMSHSAGPYVGATDVFKQEKVDHINAMTFSNKCNAFGRDMSSGKSLEHTGRAYGKKIPAAIKEAGVRRKPKKYTELAFKKEEEAGDMSDRTCKKITARYSRVSGTTSWKYNKNTKMYSSKNYNNSVKRDNIIVLFDKTEYITNPSYQGHGVTYCDYKLAGGKGYVASKGTVVKIRWEMKNYKLKLYTVRKEKIEEPAPEEETAAESENSAKDEMESAEESKPKYKTIKEPLELNPGKSWIGWISSNNGGKVSIKEYKQENAEENA